MSYEAVGWVLRDAPSVPAQCVAVLIGLADHADKRGRGAYPSAATLAEYARKSERQVRYDLRLLTEAKLIRPGDQTLVGRFPSNRRPVVYDLATERTQELEVQSTAPLPGVQQASGVQPTAPQQSTAPQSADDLQGQGGVQSTAPQDAETLGCNTAQPGVQPTADKPPINLKNSPTESSKGGVGGKESALFDADGTPPRRTRAKPTQHKPGPEFDRFYDAYPVHKARGDAEKAWMQVTRAGADPEVLIAAALRYQQDPQVLRGYGKYPAGWLRAKCWLDEPTETPPPSANGTRQTNYADEEYHGGW